MGTFQATPTGRTESTFNKLSKLAQYDDICRLINKFLDESRSEETECINMLAMVEKQWNRQTAAHTKEKEGLLAKLQIPDSNRTIGPALSKRVYTCYAMPKELRASQLVDDLEEEEDF